MTRARRTVCILIGCVLGNDPCCDRCGAGLYEEYIEVGKLYPLFQMYWRVRGFIRSLGPRTCQHCGKKYRGGYDEYMCSAKCFDEWLPF